MITDFLIEFEASLNVRGHSRSRIVEECREHLADLAAERGEQAAVKDFGDPRRLARSMDCEVAAARSVFATWATAVAVAATAFSTLVLIHSSDPAATAPLFWGAAFFAAAQVSGAATAIALIHGARIRRQSTGADDLALLARRNRYALVAAGLTMFSAGAALPGSGSAALLLAGPASVVAAGAVLIRATRLTRRIDRHPSKIDRSPYADLSELVRFRVPMIGPLTLAGLAAVAAIVRDSGEAGATATGVITYGAVEAALVLVAYVALRKPLGLGAMAARTSVG